MRFVILAALMTLPSTVGASPQSETVTQTISLKGCLKAAHDLADQVGVDLESVIDTPNVKMFRIVGSDGRIMVTCSAKERKMVLSRHPK
jgi:hypothetical protein